MGSRGHDSTYLMHCACNMMMMLRCDRLHMSTQSNALQFIMLQPGKDSPGVLFLLFGQRIGELDPKHNVQIAMQVCLCC